MSVIDASYYGAVGSTQPTGGGGAQPNPEGTAPLRTEPRAGQVGLFREAGFWIVLLVAAAFGLVRLSIRWGR